MPRQFWNDFVLLASSAYTLFFPVVEQFSFDPSGLNQTSSDQETPSQTTPSECPIGSLRNDNSFSPPNLITSREGWLPLHIMELRMIPFEVINTRLFRERKKPWETNC